jgi:hypothetical protein
MGLPSLEGGSNSHKGPAPCAPGSELCAPSNLCVPAFSFLVSLYCLRAGNKARVIKFECGCLVSQVPMPDQGHTVSQQSWLRAMLIDRA